MLLVRLNRAKLLEALSSFPTTTSIIPIVLTLQLLSYPEGTRCLRMTALQIPQHVAINQTVKMECNFNLDQELLYSVKWYKDGHEFYRFVPKDSPAVQVFPVPGVSVDINHSTERSIALNSVELSSTGRYRCEVSAEAPAFQTVSDHADMSVVVLPEKGPRITGGLAKYQEGDLVQMNCTSAPSKPAALLTWFINGEPVENKNLRGPHITAVDDRGLETAVLGLEFRVNGEHFSKGGDMNLKCLATIASMYQHGKEASIKNDDRVIKAPVMESRETRAQSHTRNDLTNDCAMEPMALGSPVGSPAQTPGTPGSNSAFLPSYLLGDSSTPARLGMIPESQRYPTTGSNSGNLQSPLSNYGTPDYRHNRQKAMFGNATSPSGGQMNTDSHTGGPPTRGLFDTVEITPASPAEMRKYASPNNRSIVNPHNQSTRLLSNNANNSIFLENVANLTSNETPSQGLLQWVTVFGFPPNAINTVLSHISNRVRIVDKHPAPHPQSNWIHLKCATEQEAQRALACNGNVVSGPIMIGVTPCMDEGVILTPDKENRGKFNGSMRIFASPGKSNDPTSPLRTGNNLRSPIKLQNARPLATGYNQHLSPQAVRSAESVPQRSTGLVSKAMEYVFGW